MPPSNFADYWRGVPPPVEQPPTPRIEVIAQMAATLHTGSSMTAAASVERAIVLWSLTCEKLAARKETHGPR